MIQMDAAILLPTCLGGCIVVFFLLFLIYRERRHRVQVTFNNHGNMNFTTPAYLSEQLSRTDNLVPCQKGDSGKEEAPVVIQEKGTFEDQAARKNLRCRYVESHSQSWGNSRGHHEQEISGNEHRLANAVTSEIPEVEGVQHGKVFSECVHVTSTSLLTTEDGLSGEKAFGLLHSPDSDKGGESAVPRQITSDEGLEMNEVDGDNFRIERNGSTVHETKFTETTLDDGVPEFCDRNSSSQHFIFTVDKQGCKVYTNYCELRIPPGATQKSLTITMTPMYNMQAESSDQALISPYVHFDVDDEDAKAEFVKDVTVSLYTGYSATEDAKARSSAKGVLVKVLWKKTREAYFKHVTDAYLCQKKFISFTCRHFCGYCIVADRSQFHSMRRNYCYTGYVRDSTAATRIFHLNLFEDCPSMCDENNKYLKGKKLVIDPEKFSVGFDYNLQIVIEGGEIRPKEGGRENFNLARHWGSRFKESHQFEMENVSGKVGANHKIKYKMFAIHNQNGPHLSIKNKHFYYEWSVPSPSQSQTINVYDSGVGMQFNQTMAEQPHAQHQTSVSSTGSGTSSGFGSPSANNESMVFEQSLESQNAKSLSGFNDDEERATTPKILSPPRSPVGAKTTQHTKPIFQSTPRQVENVAGARSLETVLEPSMTNWFCPVDSTSHSSGSTSLDSLEVEPETIAQGNPISVGSFERDDDAMTSSGQ